MSRLEGTFARLRANGRGGLVTYLTAGDPDADRSVALLTAVARAGADVLEVGVPFSDPLADGPVIQRASERALAGGMTLRGALDVVRRVRADGRYADRPLHVCESGRADGSDRLRAKAADAGVDGVLHPRLSGRGGGTTARALVDAGLDPIFLISPTTTEERIRKSAELGAGFLYVISRLGVTGVRDSCPTTSARLMARVRACADLPVALGFGIAHPDQVADACRVADAAVVGSALVNVIAEHAATQTSVEHAGEYVRWLKNVCRRARRPAPQDRRARRSARAPAQHACRLRARDRPRQEARGAAESTSRHAKRKCSGTSRRSIPDRSTTAR